MGLLLIFLVKYIWVGRPEEFKTAGFNAGMAAAQLTCEKEKKERDDAAQRDNDKVQKERAKIAHGLVLLPLVFLSGCILGNNSKTEYIVTERPPVVIPLAGPAVALELEKCCLPEENSLQFGIFLTVRVRR